MIATSSERYHMPFETPFDHSLRIGARTAVAIAERGIEAGEPAGTPSSAADRAAAASADPVVLVPGYGATAASWSAIERGLTRDGFRVHVMEPSDYSFGDVRTLARQLDGVVRGIVDAGDGARSVQVVGHSKGGIVAQEWLRQRIQEDGTAPASRLVTLGVPSHGLRPTSASNPLLGATLRMGGPTSAAILQVERGPYISGLRQAEVEYAVPTTTIYAAESDGLVTAQSAALQGATNVAVGTPTDKPTHMGLLKDDRAYHALRDALQGAKQVAPAQP